MEVEPILVYIMGGRGFTVDFTVPKYYETHLGSMFFSPHCELNLGSPCSKTIVLTTPSLCGCDEIKFIMNATIKQKMM